LDESGIPAGSEAGRQLSAYVVLLEKWNARINLTSSTDWRILGPMFQEGIRASAFYPADAVDHMDIGSGGGFPALVLKVLVPHIELDLVEPRERKVHFLATAADALGLDGVQVHAMPLAGYLKRYGEGRRWDCISWKALKLSAGDLRQLHTHTHSRTELWMFHGRELALENPESIRRGFQMVRRHRMPGTREWSLSIYRPLECFT